MAKNIRYCQICGTGYQYCPNCGEYDSYPRWMYAYHDENCKDIWGVINSYRVKAIDATEAKAELEKLDLSKKDTFVKFYKDMINKIFEEAQPDVKPEPEKKVYNNSESKYNGSKKSFKK